MGELLGNGVRLGAVKAAIWKNDTEKGVRYNTTFSRLYRDGEDWKTTDSFGRDDLLVLAKVSDQAHSWIHEQSREEEEKGKPFGTFRASYTRKTSGAKEHCRSRCYPEIRSRAAGR